MSTDRQHHAASQPGAQADALASSPRAQDARVHHAAGDAAARRMAAERRDIEMGTVNHHHFDGHDPNRVLVDGHKVHALRSTGIYANEGGQAKLLGHADAHEIVRVNAGEICELPLPQDPPKPTPDNPQPKAPPPEKRTCVLAFSVNGHSGWVDVADLEHHDALAHVQRVMSKRITAERHDQHDKFGKPVAVTPIDAPKELDGLYTYPHQTGHENEPRHYYGRPGGVCNLLVNVPHTGGTRFGVASDVVGAGTQFHRAENVAAIAIPLYEGGKHGKQTHHRITFVYGYIVNASGERRFGWMNEALVPGA